ncbi:MAG: succinyl-diaminopimelate desuccinylase [Alphaproteobacteria bacterium]|nr:succinyl-diaminopimelate desuccinylase [Alphaproteobacteria bacterium]
MSVPDPIDVVALASALIRCPSVTPEDGGALDVLEAALAGLGFTCHRLAFQQPGTERVDNLYARFGTTGPNFCYAGHTDVVPPGARDDWSRDPFAAEVADGMLHGRGATDMKGAIAAFVGAVDRHLRELAALGETLAGSISLLITGDEEGPATNGTAKVLAWMAEAGETIDVCLVGEPTNRAQLGDMIKIGRRGSLSGSLVVGGTQGHVAYPDLADNPVPRLVRMLAALCDHRLDDGTEHFQPSNLEITSIDVANPAANVIPARAEARFNIRFNDRHTAASLTEWLHETLTGVGGAHDLDLRSSGEAFLTPPGPLSAMIAGAVEEVVGMRPELGTAGGTSDARFIKDVCPVAEFGLVGQTMHKADEHVAVADLLRLRDIYAVVIDRYFAG